MVAETLPDTVNDGPVTDRELRSRLDHMDLTLHAILKLLQEVATPEAREMLASFASNPAIRWRVRHKSG